MTTALCFLVWAAAKATCDYILGLLLLKANYARVLLAEADAELARNRMSDNTSQGASYTGKMPTLPHMIGT